VIVNPASNRGRTRHRWAEIKAVLKYFLKDFRYDFTERPSQATDLAREAIKDGADLLIGVGGDGTANEIANSLNCESGIAFWRLIKANKEYRIIEKVEMFLRPFEIVAFDDPVTYVYADLREKMERRAKSLDLMIYLLLQS